MAREITDEGAGMMEKNDIQAEVLPVVSNPGLSVKTLPSGEIYEQDGLCLGLRIKNLEEEVKSLRKVALNMKSQLEHQNIF